MKKLILLIAVIFATITVFKQSVVAQNTPQSDALSAVYHSYFELKNALVDSNEKAAQSAAVTLGKNIADVPMDKLDDKHEVWMKYQSKLSSETEGITTSDIDRQKNYFVTLSENMYEVMKEIKPDLPVYYFHCPMHNKKNGGANWLSLEKEVKNPYYGSKMLTCGSLIETIK